MNRHLSRLLSAMFILASSQAFATAYNTPTADESIIGSIQTGFVKSGDTPASIAQAYDVGFNEIQNANPQIDMNHRFSSGREVVIPTEHLLPNAPRKGIVINLPEMRMYYYMGNEVLTTRSGLVKRVRRFQSPKPL